MESINMFKYSRTSTLILLPKLDEKWWDIQPEGWPNTIRWNAGHVYAEAESFLHDADHNYTITHPEWLDLFLDGTRPSEWTKDDPVPTKEEIITALKEQEKRIETFFQLKLANKASKVRDINGLLLDTVDASLQFVTWHEGLHLGILKALRLELQKNY